MPESLERCCGALPFNDAGPTRLVVVLGASSGASGQAALDLAGAVLRVLPADGDRALHFLGSDHRYDAGSLATYGGRWLSENHGRLSVLAPVLERYEDQMEPTFLVVGSSEIFDLEDWEPFLTDHKAVLASVGGDPLPGGRPTRCASLTDATEADVTRRLHDPVLSVELGGPGFLPTGWDNPAYGLGTRAGATLRADRPGPYPVRLSFLTTDPSAVRATVTYQYGRVAELHLDSDLGPACDEGASGALREDEARIFRLASKGLPFDCPQCGRAHHNPVVRCHRQSLTGDLIYRSLVDVRSPSFVVLHEDQGQVRFVSHPGTVLRVGETRALVKDGSGLRAVEHDTASSSWRLVDEPVRAYYELPGGDHAVFL